MSTIDEIRGVANAIREHDRHHIDGACYAPSGGICPKPKLHRWLDDLWSRLAEEEPARYGWAKYRSKIATHLPGGAWEREEPTIGWGRCTRCGAVGPVFYIAGGVERCLTCLEEAPA